MFDKYKAGSTKIYNNSTFLHIFIVHPLRQKECGETDISVPSSLRKKTSVANFSE